MRVSWRILLLALSAVVATTGILLWIRAPWQNPALLVVVGAFVSVVALMAWREPLPPRGKEAASIEDLEPERRVELVRGTSMYLRDMRYRYSVRVDRTGREPFTTEINTLRLGFVPVVIMDNDTERQGFGYVAFVYDGVRWRGPGLPCGGGPNDAVEHASRCVAPLDTVTTTIEKA